MKNRILSIICAIAVIAAMLTVGMINSFAAGVMLDATIDKGFVTEDFEGSNNTNPGCISDERFVSGFGATFSINTVTDYDLSGGFEIKSTLTFRSADHLESKHLNGSYASICVGSAENGIKVRIENQYGKDLYTALLYCAGTKLGEYSLANSPNGEYKLSYKNGKVAVTLNGVAIDWTLNDDSVANIVSIPSTDFLDNAAIGFILEGNSSGATNRNWSGFYLATLSEELIIKGTPLDESIEKDFILADWEGSVETNPGCIDTGMFVSGYSSVFSINTKTDYDLSDGFELKSTLQFKSSHNNYKGEYAAMYAGEVGSGIELRIYNVSGQDLYTAKLYCGGVQVGEHDLGNAPNGVYSLVCKNGVAMVLHDGVTLDWTLTDNTVSNAISITDTFFLYNASVGFTLGGNGSGKENRNWSGFYLGTREVEGEIINKSFVATDWVSTTSPNLANEHSSGDGLDAISEAGKFGAGYAKTFTIISKETYDLSYGFTFKSKLTFKNNYSNYYGEYNSMYIGDIATGLELRIQNARGEAAYNAYLYYGGNQLASYDLASAPNGEYTIICKNGTVTVELNSTAIVWTLADSTTSTEIEIGSLDTFISTAIGYRISGNYSKDADNKRNWDGVYLKIIGTPSDADSHFSNVSVSLGEDISSHCYIKGIDENATVNFTMNGVTKSNIRGTDNGNGTYKFTYTGVAPQNLGDTITAELIVNDAVVEAKSYSVLEYLNDLKNMTATELGYSAERYSAMLTLIDDLLCYGGAAQEYKAHNTESLVSSGITGTAFEALGETDFNGLEGGGISWKSGNLVFDNVNYIKIKFACETPGDYTFKYSINGGAAVKAAYASNGDGTYTILTDAINATDFDDVYRFSVYDAEGNEVAWLSYSVKSYVYAKQDKGNALAKLVQRIYMYGKAAEAFARVEV